MKKLLILTLAVLLVLAVFSGCGSAAKDFSPAEAAQAILDTGAFSDILSPVDLKIAANLYGVDASLLADGCLYCSTGATAEEIAVFKCTDANAAGTVKAAAGERLERQKAAYAVYAPEAVPAIEDAVVRASGCYVVCVVSVDAAAVDGILAKYME